MDRKTKKAELMKLILDNDSTIKNELSKIYPDNIPSNILRNAREHGIVIGEKLFNLRTGIDTRYNFGANDFKLSGVTAYAETVDSNKAGRDVKIKNPTWSGFKPENTDSLFKTRNQLRNFKSTGVLNGEFIDNLVKRQGDANKAIDELKFLRKNGDITAKQFDVGMENIFKRVNRYSGRRNVLGQKLIYDPSKWNKYGTPVGADGILRTPENFVKTMNKAWEEQGILNRIIKTATGWEIHRGHGVAAESFGPNFNNVAPQPALATTYKGTTGLSDLSANIAQGGDTIKPIPELRSANVSTTVPEAYQAYLLGDEKGINKLSDLLLSDQAKLLHKRGLSPDAADIEGRRRLLEEGAKRQLGIDNVFKPKSKMNHILKLIKKKSGKVRDIAFGKTPKGRIGRLTFLQYLDLFDPSEATELKAADIVQKRTPLTKESALDVATLYGKDLKDTGTALGISLPFITGAAKAGTMVAPAATGTFMSTAGAFSLPLGAVMLFDSYDNIFHDGKIKQWFQTNDPGRAQAEGAALTSIPGDFDYKPNQGTYKGMPIPQI